MGCFLGCFAGDRDQRRRKQRIKRPNPQVQRNRVQNVQQEIVTTAEEQTITKTPPNNLISELHVKQEQLSPSPRKRVTFNSNVTTYEHVSITESIDSLQGDCNQNVETENQYDLKTTSPSSHSPSDDDRSIVSSVGSYPPDHRYHNARYSDDEYEDSDFDDDEDDDFDDSDYESDYDESFLASSMESRTDNQSEQEINEEVESCGCKSDYVNNSVLKPIENIAQWKAAKSKSDKVRYERREIAVEASLSNWIRA
ncbi:hypothetical protein CASFOL_035476 [Castilleja foliolosa]|uniref:Uncharacterized protein n=1 Tax=Castilleja foliolosa TaxID=1961234 RepID=A0ABD3BTF8_9LAMI